jgi:hypothetical protein
MIDAFYDRVGQAWEFAGRGNRACRLYRQRQLVRSLILNGGKVAASAIAASRSACTGRIGKTILPVPSISIVGMNISRIPPTQKSPGRSVERRLLSSVAPIDDMATPRSVDSVS